MQSRPTSSTRSWGIIGLGWLGSQLATVLEQSGQETWGTHRDRFNFAIDEFPREHCDYLFLNTPPLAQIAPCKYVKKIEVSEDARVVFISSTSVYGAGGLRITEKTQPLPQSASSQWLIEVEERMQKRFGERLTVIRPGGLIGGSRHPVHWLTGKTGVTNGTVNLIHRDDLVAIVIAAVAREGPMPLLNAVTPHHPRKDRYYNQWAEKLELAPIDFSADFAPERRIESDILGSLYKDWKCPKLDFI